MNPAASSRTGVAAGAIAALCFVLLTTVRIGAQGPYFDELHQAAGAFAAPGRAPEMFAVVSAGGYALMNLPYSGAIKTNLYRLGLRLTGTGFSLVGWRLLGVSFVACGILAFSLLARSALPAWALALFLALLVSDATLLLQSRFDWGPVALGTALRLAFLGVWLRGESSEAPSAWNSFALAALVGVATFEKLSSCVLVLPLAAIMLSSRHRRSPRHLAMAALGLAVGALPLAAVNLLTYAQRGTLVSLSALGAHPTSRVDFTTFAPWYLGLAQGWQAAGFTLGLALPGEAQARGLLVAAMTTTALVIVWRRRTPAARRALVALSAWAAIGFAMHYFPVRTGPHHWILGTPFQYLAFACALVATSEGGRRAAKVAVMALALLWIAARAPRLLEIERAIWAGRASPSFDPSLNALGRFAAAQGEDVIFVASDWGVGTQIYCFTNGRPRFVHSLYAGYHGPGHWRELHRSTGARVLYLVRRGRAAAPLDPVMTRRLETDLAADPSWREVAPPPEVGSWRAVELRKFVRSDGAR